MTLQEPADDDTFLNGEVESINNPQNQADSVSTTTDASARNDAVLATTSVKRGVKPPSSLEVPSPSLASNGELPTDMGDTTEDDNIELGKLITLYKTLCDSSPTCCLTQRAVFSKEI